jgi:hypothetical protein
MVNKLNKKFFAKKFIKYFLKNLGVMEITESGDYMNNATNAFFDDH